MQLTLEADYAVRIVYTLAREQCRLDACALAEKTGVTVRFSLKILRKLVAAGLVRSYKGVNGGYEIAKEAKEISLLDIVETIEGPIHLARCAKGDFLCTREKCGTCPFHQAFEGVSQDLRRQMKAFTLDRFLQESEVHN